MVKMLEESKSMAKEKQLNVMRMNDHIEINENVKESVDYILSLTS